MIPAELKERFLDVHDVDMVYGASPSPGWKVVAGDPMEDAALFTWAMCLREHHGADQPVPPEPAATTWFASPDGSSMELVEFAVTGDPQKLAANIPLFIPPDPECTPGPSDWHELAVADLGDQQAAWAGPSFHSDPQRPDQTWIAIVRVGSVAIGLQLNKAAAARQDTPELTDENFLRLLTAAVHKVSS